LLGTPAREHFISILPRFPSAGWDNAKLELAIRGSVQHRPSVEFVVGRFFDAPGKEICRSTTHRARWRLTNVKATSDPFSYDAKMAASGGNRRIGPSHRQVLKLLANAPHGRADLKLTALFATEIIELIAAGLVEVHTENVSDERSRIIETVCVRITAAGRRAIEE